MPLVSSYFTPLSERSGEAWDEIVERKIQSVTQHHAPALFVGNMRMASETFPQLAQDSNSLCGCASHSRVQQLHAEGVIGFTLHLLITLRSIPW